VRLVNIDSSIKKATKSKSKSKLVLQLQNPIKMLR
jgi:hypothetical protein